MKCKVKENIHKTEMINFAAYPSENNSTHFSLSCDKIPQNSQGEKIFQNIGKVCYKPLTKSEECGTINPY